MAFAYVKNEHGIHRTADAGRARQLVERIAVTLLSQVMHQQKRDFHFVSQGLELSHLVVIVRVGGVNSIRTNNLKGVDDDENGIAMLQNKMFDLRTERIGKCAGCRRKNVQWEKIVSSLSGTGKAGKLHVNQQN